MEQHQNTFERISHFSRHTKSMTVPNSDEYQQRRHMKRPVLLMNF